MGVGILGKFRQLRDTPNSYSGQGGKTARVNVAEDAIEFGPTSPGSTRWVQGDRTLGNLLTDYVEIGKMASAAGYNFILSITDTTLEEQALYLITSYQNQTGGAWHEMIATNKISSTGFWAVDINIDASEATLRIRRLVGVAGAGTLHYELLMLDDIGSYTSLTGSGTGATKAQYFDSTLIYQDGKSKILGFLGDCIFLENAAMLANKINADVDTGTEDIDSFSVSGIRSVIWDVSIAKSGASRTSVIMAAYDSIAHTVNYTETSVEIGDTSDVVLSVDYSAPNIRLRATATSDNWVIKSIRRAM